MHKRDRPQPRDYELGRHGKDQERTRISRNFAHQRGINFWVEGNQWRTELVCC